MAVHLKVSNSLGILAENLSADLLQLRGSVFQPQFLVTQTTGMNNWLKIRIAGHNGITANIRFVRPNDIIYQVYFKLDGPREKVLDADHLEWVLYGLLSEPAFTNRFRDIAGYFPEGDELKRSGLARKVADLFDQYQIYRPEMIDQWNHAGAEERTKDWQCWLWVRAKEILEASMPDKTVIMDYIKTALNDPEKVARLKGRLPAIHLFGLSILTAYHIDLFRLLGEQLDICFYILNPAPGQYWYEDKSPAQVLRWQRKKNQDYAPPIEGNPLLTNWGKIVQDTFGLFFRHEEFFNHYTDLDADVPETKTLLGKLQYDIFQNATGTDRQHLLNSDLEDGSLCLNACYTPAREVEALYNYLVRQAEQATGSYSPRDIVVMVNDIDTYAPYIKAVFGAAPYVFPFTIADDSYQATDGFFSTLQLIMELREDQFRAENVLQILELAYVRQRFRISNTELIRKVVAAANIRFGIAGNLADDTVSVSWLNGLNRIIYGFCMQGEEAYELDGYRFYPLDRVEGEDAFELIRFSHFVQVLISVVKEQSRPRSLGEWSIYLENSVAGLMYDPAGERDEDHALFAQQLEQLNALAETVKDVIGFDVFRQHFINTLSGATKAGNFMSGGITFCSLIPMRSIPFKTVCLMGMNYDKFPRRSVPVSFDLMEKHPQKGDRNIKENDKHLFLETVLSARDYLYISFIGRSQKDNSRLPPSALVEELLDYIAESAGLTAGAVAYALVTVQPLHSFSRKYAGTDAKLYTYLGDTARSDIGTGEQIRPVFDFSEIDLGSFISFYKNPLKFYYNRVLGVYYDQQEVLLADTELFELDHLGQWSLRQELLYLAEEDVPAFLDRNIKTGYLPLSRMGELVLGQTMDEVSSAKVMVERCIAGQDERVLPIAVGIGGSMITGTLNRVYGDKILLTSFSKKDTKYHLECWLRHLVATAAGAGLSSHYINGRKAGEAVLPDGLLTADQATRQLAGLVAIYKSGHEQPVPFSPELQLSADKLAAMDEAGFAAYLAKSIGGEYGVQDPYLMREYENGFLDGEEVFAQWKQYVQLIYAPCQAYFEY